MAPLQVLQGDLHVQLRRAEKLYNDETLGAGVLGKAIAKVGRLKIDPYVNFIIGGARTPPRAPRMGSPKDTQTGRAGEKAPCAVRVEPSRAVIDASG